MKLIYLFQLLGLSLILTDKSETDISGYLFFQIQSV